MTSDKSNFCRRPGLLPFACFALAAGCALAAENMLKNPGFEEGTNFWRHISGSDIRIEEGTGYQGGKALVWDNDDPKRHRFPAQPVDLEPGRTYRFTALVKTDGFSGNGNDVLVGLEWYLRSGVWGGGCYGKPVDDNGIVKDGWVRYEGVTAPIPSDVARAGFLMATKDGCVGRVKFDDVTLEGREVRRIEFITTDAYRDTVSSGKVRILAALHLDVAGFSISNYMARLTYRTADRKTATVPADSLTGEEASFTLDVDRLAMGSQVVRFEVRRDGLEKPYGEASLRLTRLDRPLRRRVTYDSAHRMRLDGKPFYPLGMYTGRIKDEEFKIYADSPFNFVMQYGGVTRKDLDKWEKIGVLVATDARSFIYGYDYSAKSRYKTLAESQEALRAKYAEIGDSPALVMWYLNDEAPVSHAPNIAEVHAFLHEIDPERATLTCLCRPKTANMFLSSFDFMAVDTYPIGYRAVPGFEKCYERQTEVEAAMRSMRPHWFIPQAFNWRWCHSDEVIKRYSIPDSVLRMPSRAEFGNMCWQGIAGGANGILAYSFSTMRKYMSKDEFAASWADVCSVAREIRGMEAVLLSQDVPVAKGLPSAIVARAWRHEGRCWYVVVNCRCEAAEGRLPLGAKAGSFKQEIGSGVSLDREGDALACKFPPLGYAIVSLALGK